MKFIRLMLFAGLFILAFTNVQAEEKKHLVLCLGAETSKAVDTYFDFLQIAYAELGYTVELRRLPMRRTFNSVNEGQLDGIVITTPKVLKEYDNIILVPFPLTHIDISVFTIKQNFFVDGRKSLEPLQIGIIRGYVLTEKLTAGLDRQSVNNYQSLFSILKADRVDVVLALKREAKRFLKNKPQFENVRMLEPPFFSLPLNHCLNKKHETLVEKLNPVIERLIKEKVLEKLYKPYEI